MPSTKKPEYHVVNLHIPATQVRQLVAGKHITLKHSQLMAGHPVVLHRTKVSKIMRAHQAGKGVRIDMNPKEMELQHSEVGGGFLDSLRDAGNWLKNNIINTPFYQTAIKPIVRGVVDTGVQGASALINSKAPGVGSLASNALQSGANALGDATGAFGIRGGRARGRQYGGTLLLDNTTHRGIYTKGSALNPSLPPQDFSHQNKALAAHMVKGSQAARDNMARVRAMRHGRGAGIMAPGY